MHESYFIVCWHYWIQMILELQMLVAICGEKTDFYFLCTMKSYLYILFCLNNRVYEHLHNKKEWQSVSVASVIYW